MLLAWVESVSDLVIARKLKPEQRKQGKWEREKIAREGYYEKYTLCRKPHDSKTKRPLTLYGSVCL